MIDLKGFKEWADLGEQPFLRLLREGEVGQRVFLRWLRQEQYLYEGILGLQTSLLRRAPQMHRLVKANALIVTVEELDWLHNLELPQEPIHPVRQTYLDYLRYLEGRPYAEGTIAHWVRHRAFFEAWRTTQTTDPDGWGDGLEGLPTELSQHWLAPEAQALVHDFGSLALEVSENLGPDEVDRLVAQVLELEHASWEMALEFALIE
ncbi:MAG: hypothetical protein SFU83_04255 [Meiothermus sp.]|nr:hypothetical protein [Meiothermus sp.]